jgi:general stress protein 26
MRSSWRMADRLADLQDQTFAAATPATASTYTPDRRLSADQLRSYLGRRSYAVLGTARLDGRPHAAMSMYVRRDTTFWLPTVAGSVRGRNLRAQPWLTLVVAEGDQDTHIVVIVEGPTEIVSPDVVPDDVRTAVSGDWVSSWIRLDAERVLSYADETAQS